MNATALSDPETLAEQVHQVFTRIHLEQMAGLPLLNPMLRVETLGFREFEGRRLGLVVTPWMMSLMLFPNAEDRWDELELGKKQPHRFPANTYKFMVNEFDGIGRCQTYSLHSPMNEFSNQDHALAAARTFLETLMVPVEKPDEDPYDEDLLGRVLRGEATPEVDLDGFGIPETKPCAAAREQAVDTSLLERSTSRRDLLRGSFLREG